MALSPLAGLLGGANTPAPPQQGADTGADATQDSNAINYLRKALDNLRQAEQADTDPNEEAQIAAVAAKLKTIIAGRDKEREAAMGTTPALKFVGRHSRSGGGAGGSSGQGY